MWKNKRVGVLMGGFSAERDISLRTGAGVVRALQERGYDAFPVVLGPAPVDEAIRDADMDVAFLALHGRGGEDGCVQGVLELFGIPYTGSNVLASALAMDKLKAKELFRLHNVPTPPYYSVEARTFLASKVKEELAMSLHGSFGFPAIVKPRREGSSVGVAKVANAKELVSALEDAFRYDNNAIVERFIVAKEVHVGILDGVVLGSVEIAPKEGVYDFSAKYTAGKTDYFVPPRLEETRVSGAQRLAERAVSALGCTGAVRVDMLITEGENEYVLEVNTLPGMTETSLLPKIARGQGIEYGPLCEQILSGAELHQGIGKYGTTSIRSERRVRTSGVTLIGSHDEVAPESSDLFDRTGTDE
ncbi:MAG: D-alanine--D-alanine ligase [Polyangiaceae bacterium]|nr:D-alanine--D-alanine ligase [Polyangiaceae bacterium]